MKIARTLSILLIATLVGCDSRSTSQSNEIDRSTTEDDSGSSVASPTAELDAIYFDSENDQNQIVILNGTYFVEHEHLTEKGAIQITDNSNNFTFTIESGDAEGAPPYQVKIEELGEMKYKFYKDGSALLNTSGIYIRSDDQEELQEYANE